MQSGQITSVLSSLQTQLSSESRNIKDPLHSLSVALLLWCVYGCAFVCVFNCKITQQPIWPMFQLVRGTIIKWKTFADIHTHITLHNITCHVKLSVSWTLFDLMTHSFFLCFCDSLPAKMVIMFLFFVCVFVGVYQNITESLDGSSWNVQSH